MQAVVAHQTREGGGTGHQDDHRDCLFANANISQDCDALARMATLFS